MSLIEPTDPTQLRAELLTCPRWVLTKLQKLQSEKQSDAEMIASLETKTSLYAQQLERVRADALEQIGQLQQQNASLSSTYQQAYAQLQQLVASLQAAREDSRAAQLLADQHAAQSAQLREEAAAAHARALAEAQARAQVEAAAKLQIESAKTNAETAANQMQAQLQAQFHAQFQAQFQAQMEAKMEAARQQHEAALADARRQAEEAVAQVKEEARRKEEELSQQIAALKRQREEQAVQTKAVVDQTKSLVTKLVREASRSSLQFAPNNAAFQNALNASNSAPNSPAAAPASPASPTPKPPLISTVSTSALNVLASNAASLHGSSAATVEFSAVPTSSKSLASLPSASRHSLPVSSSSSSLPIRSSSTLTSTSSSSNSTSSTSTSTSSSSTSTSNSHRSITPPPRSASPASPSSASLLNAARLSPDGRVEFCISDGDFLRRLVQKSLVLREGILERILKSFPQLFLVHLSSQSSQSFITLFAENMIFYFVNQSLGPQLAACIQAALRLEASIVSDITTFLRGNALHVKLLASIPRVLDDGYLSALLVPFCLSLAQDDPKLDVPSSSPDAPHAAAQVLRYFGLLLDRIAESLPRLHPVNRIMCYYLQRDCLATYGPDGMLVALANAYFLRYFNPALLQPLQLLSLSPAEADLLKKSANFSSSVRLLSRLLQTMANNATPKESDSHLAAVFSTFTPRIHAFLNTLPVDPHAAGLDLAALFDPELSARHDPKKCLANLSMSIDTCSPSACSPDLAALLPPEAAFSAASVVELGVPDFLAILTAQDASVDLTSLSCFFTVLSSKPSAFDDFVPKAPSLYEAFARVFIVLNAYTSPSSLAANFNYLVEGELLQEAPFPNSFLCVFMQHLFSLLSLSAVSGFSAVAEAIRAAGRLALVDLSRLTDAEKKSFPKHVETLVDIASRFLQATLVFLKNSPVAVWTVFHAVFHSIPRDYPGLKTLDPALVLFEALVDPLLHPKLLEFPEAKRNPLANIVLDSMFKLMRIAFGLPAAPADPLLLSSPAFQSFVSTTIGGFLSELNGWLTHRPPTPSSHAFSPSEAELASTAKLFVGLIKQNMKTFNEIFSDANMNLHYSTPPTLLMEYLNPSK